MCYDIFVWLLKMLKVGYYNMEHQLPEGDTTQPDLSQEENIQVESSTSEDAAKVDEVAPQVDMLQAAQREFNKNRRIVIKRVPNISVEVS